MKLLVCTQVIDVDHPILGFFHGWILEFAKHSEVVHVICLEVGRHTLPPNVVVHSLGKEAGKGRLTYLWRFYTVFGKLFFTRQIDHVFYHMGAVYNILGAPFYFVRKLFSIKFYWWKAHGHINLVGRLAGNFVDSIITSTASGYTYHIKRRKVIGQAIDTNIFQLPISARNEKMVLFVGRIMPVKHLEVFVTVAEKLISSGYTFVVVGPVDVGQYTADLLKVFSESGVKYLGPKTNTELVALYQKAGYFLNTSMTNSMDKTVLEAMLCGCIPLTANKAFVELLGKEGLYFENQNAADYVGFIHTLEPSNKDMLRARLRSLVVDQHSLDTFFKRIFV